MCFYVHFENISSEQKQQNDKEKGLYDMNRTRSKSLLIAFVSLVCAIAMMCSVFTFTASAQTGSCGTSVTWSFDESTGILTIRGSGKMADYARMNETPWTSFASSVRSIDIGDGVTSIGRDAFALLSNVESVNVPYTVESIGENAFYGCSSLKALELPESVQTIGVYAFANCTSLTTVNIPDGVESLVGAFENCKSLKSVDIPNSVADMTFTFRGCSNLVSVEIPEGVTELVGTFSNCAQLTSITIPAGVSSITSSAFLGCYKLVEVYNLGSVSLTIGEKSNGYAAYYAGAVHTSASASSILKADGDFLFAKITGNYYLVSYLGNSTKVTLPTIVDFGGVNVFAYDVYQYAFAGNETLKEVVFSGANTTIGFAAFQDCSALRRLTIPGTVIEIANQAFNRCENLTIKYLGEEYEWDTITIGTNNAAFREATVLGEGETFETSAGEETETENSNALTGSFKSMSLHVSDSFNIYCEVELSEAAKLAGDISVTFDVDGFGTRKVTDYTVNDAGNYVFAYTRILPQDMGASISATIESGDTVLGFMRGYSVKRYCLNMLSRNASSLGMTDTQCTSFKTLLVDMLKYGAEVQKYIDSEIAEDELVTSALTQEQLGFASADQSSKAVSVKGVSGTASDAYTWKMATLVLKSKISVRFGFTADSLDGLTVKITKDGADVTVSKFEKDVQGGYYYFDYENVTPTEYDDTITVSFYKNGTQMGQSATYSVASYVVSKANSQQGEIAVVKAIYNYGCAVKAYVAA